MQNLNLRSKIMWDLKKIDFGMILGGVWDEFGRCLGDVWDMFGICLG